MKEKVGSFKYKVKSSDVKLPFFSSYSYLQKDYTEEQVSKRVIISEMSVFAILIFLHTIHKSCNLRYLDIALYSQIRCSKIKGNDNMKTTSHEDYISISYHR